MLIILPGSAQMQTSPKRGLQNRVTACCVKHWWPKRRSERGPLSAGTRAPPSLQRQGRRRREGSCRCVCPRPPTPMARPWYSITAPATAMTWSGLPPGCTRPLASGSVFLLVLEPKRAACYLDLGRCPTGQADTCELPPAVFQCPLASISPASRVWAVLPVQVLPGGVYRRQDAYSDC